ncbi:MAG: flavin monoamine oxidase family protein, partial [Bdellovibrionales bacterium]
IGWGSTALLGSGCSSLDQYFGADRRVFDNEVFIIGAGAAGLMAAHTLKKNKIPFRLFEGSSRPGGRLYSVSSGDGSTLEMGAEFFEAHHQLVFSLLKEFQLEWSEWPVDSLQKPLWQSSQGDQLTEEDYQKVAQPFINRLIADRIRIFGSSEDYRVLSPTLATELDSLSFQEYLQSHWIEADPRIVKYWDAINRTQNSADSKSVSALQVLWQTNFEKKLKPLFRVELGWSELVRRMFERISGVIPDHLVKLNWTLVSFKETQDGFRCSFKTPQGIQSATCPQVIMALPMNQYSRISGISSLKISETKLNRLKNAKLGESSKVYLSFPPTALKNKDRATWYQDQTLNIALPTKEKMWVGGLRGGDQSHWTLPDIENWALGLIERGPASSWLRSSQVDFQVMNWRDQNLIQGARGLWSPQSWLPTSALFESPDYAGRLHWAGEFVPSHEKGTVHAALESGQKAAIRVMEILKESRG